MQSHNIVEPSRRERERQQKVNALLEAAGTVFAQKGFHGSSMEEIARAAEYATGALYRYFPSKEALYIGLLQRRLVDRVERAKKLAAEMHTPQGKLRAILTVQIELAATDTSLLQIYFSERLENASKNDAWKEIEILHNEFITWMADLITEGQAEGVFSPGPPALYVTAFQGMVMALFRGWVMGTEDPADHTQQADFISSLALKAISPSVSPS